MQQHLNMNVLCCVSESNSKLFSFLTYLKKIPHIRVILSERLPADLTKFQVVITEPASAYNPAPKQLEQFVRSGGGWLGVVGLSELPISELFGVSSGPVGPESEIRVLFQDLNQPMADRLPDAVYVKGRYHPLQAFKEDVTTLLYADWHYQHRPVLVYRQADAGRVACTTLQDFENSDIKRIIYRLLHKLSGQPVTDQNL
ncbi:MAG: hypothetical protein JRF17_09060, partial [Deltaproteobacteria bacterium]|nr:hypothetical protein [Deltaproteobacteria bacterium]